MNIEEVRDDALSMNKKHWSDLILERLDDSFVKEQIKASYNLVVSKLPKKYGIKKRNRT